MAPAPKRRQCGTQQVNERLCEENYGLRERQSRIEEGIARSIATGEAQRVTRKLITIPVVVHVVYKTAAENVSDEQITSQIDALSRLMGLCASGKSPAGPKLRETLNQGRGASRSARGLERE